MRLCVFGDSFAAGVGDESGLGWVGRISSAIHATGRVPTVYPLGIRRDTSADIRARWRPEADRRLVAGEPARLIFAFGTNDCARGGDGDPRLSPEATLANVETILREAAALAPTLMLGPLPVLDDETIDARVARLEPEIAGVAARLDLPFVPLFAFARDCPAWRRGAAARDGTHPDAAGYAALAAHLLETKVLRDFLDLDPRA